MDVDREELRALAEQPIGNREWQGSDPRNQCAGPGALEAGKRASKIWLPRGKRSPVSKEAKAAKQEFAARQTDIEDTIEQAGGTRGGMRP